MKASKKRDPMKNKTGKARLGPLSLKQLNEMLEKSTRPKEKTRIRSRIAIIEARVK